MRLLLDSGADKEAKDADGITALIAAASRGRTECLRLLLDAGAQLDAADVNGRTALMAAIFWHSLDPQSHFSCIRLLLDAGADKTATDNVRIISAVLNVCVFCPNTGQSQETCLIQISLCFLFLNSPFIYLCFLLRHVSACRMVTLHWTWLSNKTNWISFVFYRCVIVKYSFLHHDKVRHVF